MHLAELIGLRTTPGAGLLLALTERCPLRCAHCCTDSTMRSAESGPEPFLRLVRSFETGNRPELIFMSGGEPLLRPDLVAELARSARLAGTRSAVLSGMFFARAARIGSTIRAAIAAVDHFSASLDVYHEREVDRYAVFAALRVILDLVPGVSVHVTGHGDDDPYVASVLADLREAFDDRIPVLVTTVRPAGRAAGWAIAAAPPREGPNPCEFAAWPLADYDGWIYACCQQNLARRSRAPHLVLGHAATDGWPAIRARTLAQPVLRAVRTVGPREVARRAGSDSCGGMCATCVALPPGTWIPPALESAAGHLVAQLTPQDLARRWGAGTHAALVNLGWPARRIDADPAAAADRSHDSPPTSGDPETARAKPGQGAEWMS